MVTEPASNGGDLQIRKYNVIDGQQRLTSLTIFAAALLDICVQHNVGSPIFSSIFSTNPRPFITINEGNDYFFATIIEPSRAENSREARKVSFDRTTADSDVHNRIRTNYYEIYRLISLYLQDILHNKKGFQLGGILETFLDYLYIVRIHVPNNANIIRIFRTLNERGVDLSQGDITKSIIFESVLNDNSALAQVSLLWQETFDQIDSEGTDNLITEYLRHYHISTRSYIAEGKLSTEIERYLVQLEGEDPKAAQTFSKLVQSGVATIKFAMREHGIYHEKYGIFEDELGRKVAFMGSLNET
jgi:uncharacterized protein with ParB-like and HNH nuclease domain